MQTYTVEITGPNGNGLYSPEVNEWNFSLQRIYHPMDKRNPIPAFLLPELLLYLNKVFAFNYVMKITPFTE